MDLLKTPSVQSLLDSDLESVESFQDLDIEELDEVEYALPASQAPTLAEVLSADDELDSTTVDVHSGNKRKENGEPVTCSALQVEFLQAVSQQLAQAQERSSAGASTTLSVGKEGKITVGTAHGHLLSFQDQTLRWVCSANTDGGAVSCIAYNQDSTRLLVGYARGLICQYESIKGIVLRRVTLGCDIWGTLKVTWAGTSGLALDTGGSVWLIKFSRPLGVRSAKTSCLFSGARGEVVAMTARDARILALATLSRVIIVAGGRAAGVRLGGPPNTLPVLGWSENDDRILVCARNKSIQWLFVNITGSNLSLRPLQKIELKATPLWIGWLSGCMAIFDVDENLRLWGEEYDKPLDLSHVEPVYASAFFKGHWTDGRVSQAMVAAGASALGGACIAEGALSLLGRKGIVRVKPRDLLARAQAFSASGHHLQALRLLCFSLKGTEVKNLAKEFIVKLSERPHILGDKKVADQAIKLCVKFNLSDELWNYLWENCSDQTAFVEALGDAVVRGDLATIPPTPDFSQALIEKLAEFEPGLVERVVASLPLTSLDPHRASVFTRQKRLWRGVGAIAAAIGGPSEAMRELMAYVDPECATRVANGEQCACAGGALLLVAADALAGRGAAGRALPDHARPKARHDALLTLLGDDAGADGSSPLRALLQHDASAAVQLLVQSSRDPPFAGPLAKQNRRRVARALLDVATTLPLPEQRTEIVEFVAGQLSSGALPADPALALAAQALASITPTERADRAWVELFTRTRRPSEHLATAKDLALHRPRVLWRLHSLMGERAEAIQQFFQVQQPSDADIDELFQYIRTGVDADDSDKSIVEPHLARLIKLRPRAVAALVNDHFTDSIAEKLISTSSNANAIEFAEYLLETGKLRGAAATAHLRNLCMLRPGDVATFLTKNPGVVKPEDALAIVRETRAVEAEALCLEATGDPQGALEALIGLITAANERGDQDGEARLVEAACALCRRAAAAQPEGRAAELWTRLLQSVRAPPALLLDAQAFLPADQLVEKTCDSPAAALTILKCAAGQRTLWEVALRICGREAHAGLARALVEARRGLRVRHSCARCGRALSGDGRPARTAHCGRAFHADCEPEPSCAVCGLRAPANTTSLPSPPRAATGPSEPRSTPSDADLALCLVAPPRPDLEGIV